MNDLIPLAETIAARLKARRESIAIAEASTGGLISAALLALPGASAYFLGGAVAYTRQAKVLLLGLDDAALTEFGSATEPHAAVEPRAAAEAADHWNLYRCRHRGAGDRAGIGEVEETRAGRFKKFCLFHELFGRSGARLRR